MLALVDADSIVYICGFAIETSTFKVGTVSYPTRKEAVIAADAAGIPVSTIQEEIIYEPLANALQLVKNCLTKIKTRTGCTDMRIFLSGVGNFRDDIATIQPYKGKRPDRKPFWYKEIRKYLVELRGAEVVNGIEADDALAMFAANNTILCTIDKDLDQIVGLHYNYQKDCIYDVSEDSALRSFYTQLLTGDTTDNIRGVPGIGPKTARKLMKECKTEEEMYWTCLNEYCRTHDKALEALMENANLLYLIREPKDTWEPPI